MANINVFSSQSVSVNVNGHKVVFKNGKLSIDGKTIPKELIKSEKGFNIFQTFNNTVYLGSNEISFKNGDAIVNGINLNEYEKDSKESMEEVKNGKKINKKKAFNYRAAVYGTAIAIFATSLLLKIGFSVNNSKVEKQNEKDIKLACEAIEKNIALSNMGIKNFAFRAVNSYEKDSKYFAQFFGQATYNKDEKAMLTSVSYKIDENLYREMEDLLDIKFETDNAGKVTGTENERQGDGAKYSKRLKAVFEQLVEVTQDACLGIEVLGNASDVAKATQKSMTKNSLSGMIIENMTKPIIKGNSAVFEISVLAEVKEGEEKSVKRISLEVTQPLNHDIEENVSRCYLNYIKNKNVQTEVKGIESVGQNINIKLLPQYDYEIEKSQELI